MAYAKEQALLSHYNNYPHGGTTVRDPQLIRIMFEISGIHPKPGSEVLDLGCASGVMADIVRTTYNVHVTGIDSASSRIAIGRQERPDVRYILDDMHNFLETTQDRFDLIMLFDTIEHTEEPKKLIDNARKVLKTNGKIISKTPLNFPYEAHLQVFTSKEDFDSKLEPTRSIKYGQSVIAIWE